MHTIISKMNGYEIADLFGVSSVCLGTLNGPVLLYDNNSNTFETGNICDLDCFDPKKSYFLHSKNDIKPFFIASPGGTTKFNNRVEVDVFVSHCISKNIDLTKMGYDVEPNDSNSYKAS